VLPRGRPHHLVRATRGDQADLDRFLASFNLERSHQGYRLRGNSPAQALREALAFEDLPALTYPLPAEEDAIEQPEAA
jgi:hypothetical protein